MNDEYNEKVYFNAWSTDGTVKVVKRPKARKVLNYISGMMDTYAMKFIWNILEKDPLMWNMMEKNIWITKNKYRLFRIKEK